MTRLVEDIRKRIASLGTLFVNDASRRGSAFKKGAWRIARNPACASTPHRSWSPPVGPPPVGT